MRITRIEMIGDAGRHGSFAREPGAEYIDAVVMAPGEPMVHKARANDRDDLWRLAQYVQAALDGRRGAGGDIRDYFSLLERLGD